MLYDAFIVPITENTAEGAIVEIRCLEFLGIIWIFYRSQLVCVVSGATSGDVVERINYSEDASWSDVPNRRTEERECPQGIFTFDVILCFHSRFCFGLLCNCLQVVSEYPDDGNIFCR